MPIYHVQTPSGEHVVDATNQAAAVNHVVRETITVKNLTASELVELQGKGLTVEKAGTSKPVEKQEADPIIEEEIVVTDKRETAGEMDLSGPVTNEADAVDQAA